MTLYLIGIGLYDEKDISIRGLEIARAADFVYLETYTSRLNTSLQDLEKLYGKRIVPADRTMVEKNADDILSRALKADVCFLIVGDVFSATTHTDLFLRAKEKGIEIQVIHNASVLTAVGIVGLELYKYGPVTSMPYFEKNFEPETPYNVLKSNRAAGQHTLLLLDIKADQKRYMTVNEAILQFMKIEEKRKEEVFTEELMIAGCARLGSPESMIRYGKVRDLRNTDFGSPLHCIVVPGKLHFMEEEMLKLWSSPHPKKI